MLISKNNKNHHTRLQDHLRNLDSRPNLTDLNRTNPTSLKLILSPICPVQGRTFLRGVVTQSSSPPLNMPRLPQSSESQPFPVPYHAQIFQWEEDWPTLWNNGENKPKTNGSSLSYETVEQDIIQFSSPFFDNSDKSESIFLPVITRRDNGTSPDTGSGKGTYKIRFLFLAISCAEKE